MKYSSLSTSAAVLKKRYKQLQLYTKYNDITPIDTELVDNIDWEFISSRLKEYIDEHCRASEESGLSMELSRCHKRMQALRSRRKAAKRRISHRHK